MAGSDYLCSRLCKLDHTSPTAEQVREEQTKQHRLRPVYRNDILVESLLSVLLSLPCFLSTKHLLLMQER